MGERCKKLQSCIEELFIKSKIVDIVISECFNKYGEHKYLLHKLGLEVEDGEVYFYDKENIVSWEDTSVLNGFLISSIINDPEITDNEVNIVFKDGNINIKVVG